ncbi:MULTISPECIES: PTS glucose transporter subunit IIA [Clostridia]|uniref:PTS sugar transporter subunit IIA n=1 Tax=Clostridia TaxID=186801 RepID=UPI000EA136D6|nr:MULTISPECIES: PTS glucose transporter subunit IIA [Clostridia]NBJ70093.1 PTS glucose transporter subunit IIA [Roseburia sp. 1XD42-34]RKI77266.1 PTS glucose transporter subunit IIA [Clostridium sp. 1xD42-85]
MFKNLFKKPKEQIIYAPLNGDIIPLEEVPDPVFNQKMMGEGIAIIPSDGKLVSPVNGKVVQIPDTKHAIGLIADDSTEILIHVGLETVALNGKGFNVKVAADDEVKTGDVLMDFDLAYIQEHASSTVTPIIITNSNDGSKKLSFTDERKSTAGETVLITVTS